MLVRCKGQALRLRLHQVRTALIGILITAIMLIILNQPNNRIQSVRKFSLIDPPDRRATPHTNEDLTRRSEPHRILFMCHNGHLKTLIYVHTSPDRFLDRKELRRYLHRPPETAVVFMLGKSKNKSLAHLVFQEAEQFEDMVIFDAFVDSYRNLTPKSVHSIRWIQNECGANPMLRNIVKLDDDVWVNFPMLKSYLHLEIPKRPYRIHCLVWRRVRVARRPRSKWFVSKVEYGLPYYPPYCGGLAYILPKQLLTDLVNASYKVPFFWVDDIYVTGLLAREAHLDDAQIRTYYAFQVNQNINLTADWEETIMNAFGATKIMFSHMDTPFLRSLRSFLFQRINETLLNYTQFTVF